MVTPQQARQQLEQRKLQIQQTKLRQLTRAQLQQQTRGGMISRQQAQKQLEASKRREIESLQPIERQVSKAEQALKTYQNQIKQAQQLHQDLNIAEKLVLKGASAAGLTGRIRKFFNAIQARKEQDLVNSELNKLGLKPVYSNGKLTGFESKKLQQSFGLQYLPEYTSTLQETGKIPTEFLPREGIFATEPFTPIPSVPTIPMKGAYVEPTKGEIKSIKRPSESLITQLGKGLDILEKKLTTGGRVPGTGGVLGLLGMESKKGTKDFIFDVESFTQTGKGTVITTPRQATFFEKYGINPNDQASLELKARVDNIQKQLEEGIITEEVANGFLEKSINDFTKFQILKGIAPNMALGAAFGMVSAIPIAGAIANSLLMADVFLRRNELASQFSRFPRETALSTAAFLVGGLTGSRVVAGVKGKITDLKIDPANLKSVIKLGGKEKGTLSKLAIENLPELKLDIKQGKISDSIAYQVIMKDGRIFDVVEFSKLKLPSGKIDKIFIGFERALRGGEVFAGRGVGRIEGPKGKIFTRIIKFRQSPTKLGRFIQRRFGSGRVIDLLEKTRVTGARRIGRVGISRVESTAALLKTEGARGLIIGDIIKLIENVKAGRKVSTMRLKKIINIDRVLENKEPLLTKQFNEAQLKLLTDAQLLTVLTKLKGSLEKKFGRFDATLRKLGVKKEEIVVGLGRAKGIEIESKIKVTKTPLEKTFARESPIIKRAKQLAKMKPFAKLKKVSKKKVKAIEGGPISVTAAAFAAGVPLPRPRFPKAVYVVGGPLSLGLTLTPVGVQNNLSSIKSRLSTISRTLLSLKTLSKQKQTELTRTRIESLTNQREELLSRQRSLQILEQKLELQQKRRQRQIKRTSRLTFPLPSPKLKPIVPFIPPLIGPGKKKKLFFEFPKLQREGFNVFVKQKGKFKKVNVKPLKRSDALSLGAFVADKSLAASFKIGKAKKDAKKPLLQFPKRHYTRNLIKFRRAKKNKKTIVEKKRYRLDSVNEVKKIQAARLLADMKKRRLGIFKLKSRPLIKLKKKRK